MPLHHGNEQMTSVFVHGTKIYRTIRFRFNKLQLFSKKILSKALIFVFFYSYLRQEKQKSPKYVFRLTAIDSNITSRGCLKNTFELIFMEENRKSGMNENDKEIVFSQAIKAGKRIYYIDVKKNRKEEMYISITESKKLVSGEGENATVSFEKHKIFLYREDFAKFANSLNEAISYVVAEQGEYVPRNFDTPTEDTKDGEKVNIDIEF